MRIKEKATMYLGAGRKQVNKEYYQAKADLCRNLAIKQMVEGEAKEAGANLIRMVNALNNLETPKNEGGEG